MAVQPGGGGKKTSKKTKPLWAYIPKGTKKGGRAPIIWGGGWVKVGSAQWTHLNRQGFKPTKYERTRFNPGKARVRPSPDTQDAREDARKGNESRRQPIKTWIKRAKNGNRKATLELQKFLRRQGYRITIDGQWGPQTAAAVRQFNKGNPDARTGKKGDAPNSNPVTRFNKSRFSNKPKKGGGRGKAKQQQATFKAVGGKVGKANIGSTIPRAFADDIAGMQFDPAIRDLKTVIERLGPQNAQALADITNWYGQVAQANTRAQQRNVAGAERVADEQDAAAARLIESLGGGANAANPVVAAEALGSSNLLRQLGGIDETFHNDMDPILEQAAATAKAQQQARNLEQMQNYQLELANLMGQRGQAKSAALMDIIGFNNALAQQRFQNRLAKLEASTAAAISGLDLRAKQAALKQAQQQNKGGFIPWKRLQPPDRHQLIAMATGLRQKPNGRAVPSRSLSAAVKWLQSQGYKPGKNQNIMRMLRTYYD